MSEFTTELKVDQLGDSKYYILTEGFEYHVGDYPSDEVIVVPAGFITDFASSPKFLHWLIPPKGKYGKACVIHDFCYFTGYDTKFRCDSIFLEGMEVLEVPKWKRETMYYGVVVFGWYGWFEGRSGRAHAKKEELKKIYLV